MVDRQAFSNPLAFGHSSVALGSLALLRPSTPAQMSATATLYFATFAFLRHIRSPSPHSFYFATLTLTATVALKAVFALMFTLPPHNHRCTILLTHPSPVHPPYTSHFHLVAPRAACSTCHRAFRHGEGVLAATAQGCMRTSMKHLCRSYTRTTPIHLASLCLRFTMRLMRDVEQRQIGFFATHMSQ